MFTNKRTKNLNFDKVKINKIPIEYSDGASYLGTFLDAKLTFKKHIEDKIKKCKKHLFALKSLIGKGWGLSPWLMKWAFTGIIRPKLTYGCHIYKVFFFKRKHIKKILKCIENFKHVNFQYKSVLLQNKRCLKFYVFC